MKMDQMMVKVIKLKYYSNIMNVLQIVVKWVKELIIPVIKDAFAMI